MKISIFQTQRNDEWYWHLKASNGRIVAIGGESYSSFDAVCRAVRRVFRADLWAEAEYAVKDARGRRRLPIEQR